MTQSIPMPWFKAQVSMVFSIIFCANSSSAFLTLIRSAPSLITASSSALNFCIKLPDGVDEESPHSFVGYEVATGGIPGNDPAPFEDVS